MKIYFIGQKGIPTQAGGIEKHVESIATRMAAKGHEVFVYTRPHYTDRNLKEYEGVHLISLPSFNKKNLDAITHTFLASIHVLFRRADVIHYHGIGPSLLLWIPKIFKPRARVISTVHSDDRKHTKWSPFAKFMLGLGAKIAVRWSDAAVAIAKYQKRDFEEEFGGRLTYIPNGVSIPRPIKPDLITKEYGLIGDDYILFVSRFVPHKGLHLLINAYNKIPNPGKKLVIVGSGAHTDSYTREVRELAAENPNIILTGTLTGKIFNELYSNAFLFVIPSEYEGLSIALLEVMSYGTPVLASDIEPNLEALGGRGFTFKSGDQNDLHAKLSYLLAHEDEVRASGPSLKERVAEEYGWDLITEDILKLYKALGNQ